MLCHSLVCSLQIFNGTFETHTSDRHHREWGQRSHNCMHSRSPTCVESLRKHCHSCSPHHDSRSPSDHQERHPCSSVQCPRHDRPEFFHSSTGPHGGVCAVCLGHHEHALSKWRPQVVGWITRSCHKKWAREAWCHWQSPSLLQLAGAKRMCIHKLPQATQMLGMQEIWSWHSGMPSCGESVVPSHHIKVRPGLWSWQHMDWRGDTQNLYEVLQMSYHCLLGSKVFRVWTVNLPSLTEV